jgi:pyruvate/2-oxoglutarate dehydrogenase complex dihydrolipoamide acyltransferase (E2) component
MPTATIPSPSAPSFNLTLGYDHRIIGGSVADQFMASVKKLWKAGGEDVG